MVKNITAASFSDLEKSKNDNGFDMNVQYVGSSNSYTEGYHFASKYNSKTNGVSLSGTKNFGRFTLGGGFGYQNSDVKYKNVFAGIKEDIDSYQLSLSGKYDITDNVDLMGVFTYGNSKHKYTNSEASFKSDITDFQTRLGYKFKGSSDSTYLKPYAGLGITSVNEKEFTLNGMTYGKAKNSSGNATAGLYGQTSLGPVDLYGNMEYVHRFDKDSYHGERDVLLNGAAVAKARALDYKKGMFNLGLGARYNINSNFNLTVGYELHDTKNSVFKVGFGTEF